VEEKRGRYTGKQERRSRRISPQSMSEGPAQLTELEEPSALEISSLSDKGMIMLLGKL